MHRPRAAILACADARVPPSLVFDQPLGALFVVRKAGNTAEPETLANLDFAVADLGVDVVVVLGHTECGAVNAALEHGSESIPDHLEAIVAPIRDVVADLDRGDPDVSARASSVNVAAVVDVLRNHDGPVGDGVREGRVDLVGVVHDLGTGELTAVTDLTLSSR